MNQKNIILLAAGAFALAGMTQSALAAGDASAGETLFNHTCKLCHQVGPGAKNFVGPELNGIDGRKTGSAPGYDYSDANKNSGITWNEQTFKKYITNPQADVPGTKMIFAGLPKESDRDNIWAYISQFKADGSK